MRPMLVKFPLSRSFGICKAAALLHLMLRTNFTSRSTYYNFLFALCVLRILLQSLHILIKPDSANAAEVNANININNNASIFFIADSP